MVVGVLVGEPDLDCMMEIKPDRWLGDLTWPLEAAVAVFWLPVEVTAPVPVAPAVLPATLLGGDHSFLEEVLGVSLCEC